MRNLYKLFLITGILVLSGCGKEQSGQSTAASPAPAPAPSTAMSTPAATTTGKDNGMDKMEQMEKPAWARLEQNVYHYPQ